MCNCDCVSPEFFDQRHPVARKDHRCVECRRVRIRKGDKYRRCSGKWDGEFDSHAQCMRCAQVWDRLYEFDSCICFGQLREALHEYNRNVRYEKRRMAS